MVHLGEDVLVDAVIVPLIERRQLVGPDGVAVLDLAGEHAERPFVVEVARVAFFVGLVRAAIGRAPQTRVGGRVEQRSWCRGRSCTSPKRCRRRSCSPRREGLDAEILTVGAVFGMGLVGVGRQAHFLVGAGVLAGPGHRAVLEVVGHHAAARGELAAAEADDHLVVGDQRSRRDGLALLGPGMLDDPDLLAGLAVERDQEAVERAVDELAVGV